MKLQAEIGVMQPQLKNAWSNWKLEEALDRDFRRSRALPTSQFQISSLQNCVRKKFCCSKPPSLCNLSQQFQEANTDGEMGQNYKSASRLQKGFDLSCFQSTSGEQSAFSPPTHQLITLFSSETPGQKKQALMTKDLALRSCMGGRGWGVPQSVSPEYTLSQPGRLREQDSGSSNLFWGLADSQL